MSDGVRVRGELGWRDGVCVEAQGRRGGRGRGQGRWAQGRSLASTATKPSGACGRACCSFLSLSSLAFFSLAIFATLRAAEGQGWGRWAVAADSRRASGFEGAALAAAGASVLGRVGRDKNGIGLVIGGPVTYGRQAR